MLAAALAVALLLLIDRYRLLHAEAKPLSKVWKAFTPNLVASVVLFASVIAVCRATFPNE